MMELQDKLKVESEMKLQITEEHRKSIEAVKQEKVCCIFQGLFISNLWKYQSLKFTEHKNITSCTTIQTEID